MRGRKPIEVKVAQNQSQAFNKVDYKDIYAPPGFDPASPVPMNNLAVIELMKNLTFNGTAFDIETKPDAYLKRRPHICGYGYVNNSGARPSKLQCIQMTVVETKLCDKALSGNPLVTKE